jgi:hypothetical protein
MRLHFILIATALLIMLINLHSILKTDGQEISPDDFASFENFTMEQAKTSDFSANGTCNLTELHTTSCKVAKDLTSLNAEEIKNYGLTDFSDTDIENALNLLDPENLTKVLLNIHHEDLLQINDRLTNTTLNNILSKIHEQQRMEILNKIQIN